MSRLMASRTVFREASYWSLSSPSVGSFAFGSSCPVHDLRAQVVSDVPVHRLVLRHRPSIGTNNPDGPICQGHRNIRCCLVYALMSMV